MCSKKTFEKYFGILCSFRKYLYLPLPPSYRRDWQFQGVGVDSDVKKSKEMYEANWIFHGGGGGVIKNPFCGVVGMDYFSRTAYCEFCP